MSIWLWVALTVWTVLAVGVGSILGRGIRIADQWDDRS